MLFSGSESCFETHSTHVSSYTSKELGNLDHFECVLLIPKISGASLKNAQFQRKLDLFWHTYKIPDDSCHGCPISIPEHISTNRSPLLLKGQRRNQQRVTWGSIDFPYICDVLNTSVSFCYPSFPSFDYLLIWKDEGQNSW
jgi:hypothetical protein